MPTSPLSTQLDAITRMIDLARRDITDVLRGRPAVTDLANALDLLRQAACAVDRAHDTLGAEAVAR